MLQNDRPPAELTRHLGFMLKWLGDRSARRFASALAEHGFHPREFGLLSVVAGRPGLTQQELAELAGIDRSSMVALLDELDARGLAERRVDPADRRKRAIHLTADGAAAMARLGVIARAVSEEAFGVLDAGERATLERLLRKLAGVD